MSDQFNSALYFAAEYCRAFVDLAADKAKWEKCQHAWRMSLKDSALDAIKELKKFIAVVNREDC